jgi:hypothetical protein
VTGSFHSCGTAKSEAPTAARSTPENFTDDPESEKVVSGDAFNTIEGLDVEESDDGFIFFGGEGFGGGSMATAAGSPQLQRAVGTASPAWDD